MSIYEFAELQAHTSAAPTASAKLERYLKSDANRGSVIGCWISEIGALNRIALLRRYDDPQDHETERRQLMTGSDPFACGVHLKSMSLDRCVSFPGVPEPELGRFGPFYEIRTYEMETGGLAPTLATWEQAIPVRRRRSHLVTVLHTVEGTPRMVSIWPYASIEDRQTIRAQAIADGVWPPKDSHKHLKTEMLSTIYLPTAYSPLQ